MPEKRGRPAKYCGHACCQRAYERRRLERLTQDQASAALAKDLAATKGLDERKLRRRIAQLEQELELERQFNHAARDER